ncbi:MAG: hypothetical protein KAX51_13080 [Chromatiaceae bacterium]|nr:hypothetical protein [Chromatiaceae bacterium]MBP8290715.1 hypothetical protein [Chromatiaceae bacterium]
MKITLSLLLALFAMTTMAVAPTEATAIQTSDRSAGPAPPEPVPPSGYRGRFGSSAASRNARHLSSELEAPATDEAKGCHNQDSQNPKPTPSAACANQFL